MSTLEFRDAIRDALAEELERDPSVVFFGEDVAAAGGVFKVTPELFERLKVEARRLGMTQEVWNWVATVRDELRRIASHRTVDIVGAAPADGEIAALLEKDWPLVTSVDAALAP